MKIKYTSIIRKDDEMKEMYENDDLFRIAVNSLNDDDSIENQLLIIKSLINVYNKAFNDFEKVLNGQYNRRSNA